MSEKKNSIKDLISQASKSSTVPPVQKSKKGKVKPVQKSGRKLDYGEGVETDRITVKLEASTLELLKIKLATTHKSYTQNTLVNELIKKGLQ